MNNFWNNTSTTALCIKLLLACVMMFSFALFVMPPLYVWFCEVTGLNGKTDGPYTGGSFVVDESRWVKVQFIASKNAMMPWEFRPTQEVVNVNPGKPTVITYFAKNTTDHAMVAQASPSLSPYEANDHFHKIECFCFNKQPLAAGESAELGLSFTVDPELPHEVNTITLSYTLFDVTDT